MSYVRIVSSTSNQAFRLQCKFCSRFIALRWSLCQRWRLQMALWSVRWSHCLVGALKASLGLVVMQRQWHDRSLYQQVDLWGTVSEDGQSLLQNKARIESV